MGDEDGAPAPEASCFLSLLLLPKAIDESHTKHNSLEDILARVDTCLMSLQSSVVPIVFMNVQTGTPHQVETALSTMESLFDLANMSLYGFEAYHGVNMTVRLWYTSTADEMAWEIKLQQGDTNLGFAISHTKGFRRQGIHGGLTVEALKGTQRSLNGRRGASPGRPSVDPPLPESNTHMLSLSRHRTCKAKARQGHTTRAVPVAFASPPIAVASHHAKAGIVNVASKCPIQHPCGNEGGTKAIGHAIQAVHACALRVPEKRRHRFLSSFVHCFGSWERLEPSPASSPLPLSRI